MTENDFRYQLRIKRAILEAHVAAMTETIEAIEYSNDDYAAAVDKYISSEPACFAKYWKIALEMK